MMLLGQVIYRREADDAVMLYEGEVDGWEMARVVAGGREFEPHTLFALLARGGWEPTSGVPVEPDEDTVVKHFQGTENDHDQQSHAGSTSIVDTGGRLTVDQLSDTTFQYQYGDFTVNTDITSKRLLEESGLDGGYTTDDPPSAIEDLGEVAIDSQWNQWEGNFVMRHLSAAMMGLPHVYASGGEGLVFDITEAITYGDTPEDEGAREYVQQFLDDHAATTHGMLQAIADGTQNFADPWDGIVQRGMTVDAGRDDNHPLFRLYDGDTVDLALSAFSPMTFLTNEFLRGGEMSREMMQSDEDFVFTPNWRSVMFELDTATSKTLRPANWQELAAMRQEDSGRIPVPHEVVTQGKFRVSGIRDESREFRRPWSEGSDGDESEDMRVITLQQTAVYNPRTSTYDALPGFITLPDGQVIPIEEA